MCIRDSFKAVFGSAYQTSDLVNYPDVVSISGSRQRQDSYAACQYRQYVACRFIPEVAHYDSACATSAFEGACPRDVSVTSLPVAGSTPTDASVPCQSFLETSPMICWNAVSDQCSEKSVDRKSFDDEKSVPVSLRLSFLIT